MRTSCLLLLCMFLGLTLVAQDGSIAGRLLDAQTQEPIPFATVRIKNYALGVISNMDGSFRVPERFNGYGDVLVISSMGYRTMEIRISELSPGKINIIGLKSGIISLQEAVVSAKKRRPLSARQIVRRAIRAIPNNYPTNDYSIVGYYRDYQFDQEKYVNLNEAILEVFDTGFDDVDSVTTRVGLYRYEPNNKFGRDTLADGPYNYQSKQKIIDDAYLYGYGGNEFTILRVHDAIRNYKINSFDFINTLESDLLKNHSFQIVGDTYLDTEQLFTIKFKKVHPSYSAVGTLYISKFDYAIHKMAYAVYHDRERQPDSNKNNKGANDPLIFEITTEYKRQAGKMYLNYISLHNTFLLREPPKFIFENFTVVFSNRCFYVYFNNQPKGAEALSYGNYDIRFKGKKLRFERIKVTKNSVLLYPDMDPVKAGAMFMEMAILAFKEKLDATVLTAKVKNIKDVSGNVVDQPTEKGYNQFREFFAQQIIPNKAVPIGAPLMKMNRPIFKDQPLMTSENMADYWMNTPLQNIEQPQ